jgi:hypothetical protein
MAMQYSNLTYSSNNTSVSSLTTATITPANGSLIIVSVGNNHDNISTNVPTVSGLSLTWNQIITQNDTSGTQGERSTMFCAAVTGFPSGTLTISWAGQSQSNAGYSVDQFQGAIITNNGINGIRQSAGGSTNGSSQSISLSAFANVNNMCLACFANGGGSTGAGSGFTGITPTSNRFFAEYAVNNATAAYSFTGSNDSVGTAIEIIFGGSFLGAML